MTNIVRNLAIAAGVTAAAITAVPPATAGATPSHRSCRGLGALAAEEGRNHITGEENPSLPHGSVDDLIHVVQIGGDFLGEPVPAFCDPR